jgi:predicted DNA-binding protein
MSFVFPSVFHEVLQNLSKKYNKDMTYIVMEAVNEWVLKKENITFEELGFGFIPGSEFNNGHERNFSTKFHQK